MLKKLKKWLPSKRKIMQLYFAVLFNANLKGFITGNIYQGGTKNVCAPGINCYSCPGAVGACPLGTLQGALSAKNHSTMYYVGGILLLYCIMFGRMICGWLCPFGLVQEVAYKIKTPKVKKSRITRLLSWFKYVVLVFFVFIVPIMYAFRDYPLPAFCKYICPAGTLEGGISLLSNKVNEGYFSMLGPIFTWKFLLLVSTIVGCIFVFRLFCRFFCPLGALYGLFNKLSFFGIKVDNSKCTQCGLCKSKCKMDIRHVGDQECISCGECVTECPTQAIQWKGPKILLKANETITQEQHKQAKKITRIISAVLLLAILVGSVSYYWTRPDTTNLPIGTEETGENAVPLGNKEGYRCYGYDLPLVDGNGLTGQTQNPAETGKITVINFWGTWCSPCVAELPHFEQIAQDYADSVTVYAVHSAGGNEEAPAYIADHYPEAALIFACDQGEGYTGEYYSMLGGRGTYPYTLILDAEGVIQKVFVSSVTHEELVTAVESILNP